MMYNFVLAAHIAVACLTMVLIAYSAIVLLRGAQPKAYKRLLAAIPSLALLETLSGFALAVLSPDITVAEVGLHLTWYLGLCLIAEAALLYKAREVWVS